MDIEIPIESLDQATRSQCEYMQEEDYAANAWLCLWKRSGECSKPPSIVWGVMKLNRVVGRSCILTKILLFEPSVLSPLITLLFERRVPRPAHSIYVVLIDILDRQLASCRSLTYQAPQNRVDPN